MQRIDGLPSPEENARAILARRLEGQQLLEDAERSGNKKEARELKAILRKWDKMIADYGLNRYA